MENVDYASYGLDTVKKEADEGTVGYFYCPWCQKSNISSGFSLCFANFCICLDCVNAAKDLKKQWKADDGNGCFKCAKEHKHKKVYEKLFYDKAGSCSICEECLEWAGDVLTNKEKYLQEMAEQELNQVLEVIKSCKVEGNVVKLPEGQLDRKIYEGVKKKLELIGGKWKGGKIAGFVFEEDPADLLEDVASGDGRDLKKEFQFFPTPRDIGKDMILLLRDIFKPGMKLLEPSAGDGALIKAFIDVFGPHYFIECYELMELNVKKLYKIPEAVFIDYDFFNCDLKDYYDIIIANPPFTKNQDIDHIRKMYEVLKPGGTIVTLCSQSWYTGSQKKQVEFKDWLESMSVFPVTLPAKSFQESGTNITPLRLMIQKPVEVKQEFDIETAFGPSIIPQDLGENIQPPIPERTCRVCGCTDDDCRQCIEKTGSPCYWVDDDLCSACASEESPVMVQECDATEVIDYESLNQYQLADLYKEKYGIEAEHQDYNKLLAALTFNKRIKQLTDEDIKSVKAVQVSDTKEPEPEPEPETVTEVQKTDKEVPQSVQILQEIKQTNKEIDKGILELEQMLSPAQTNDMNFFRQLYELMDGIDVNIHFKRINGQLELKVIPETGASVKPVSIKGSPEDFDQDFFKVIQHPIERFKGLKLEMDEFHKSAVKAKEEAKPAEKTPEAKKPVEKPKVEKPKEEVKQKTPEPSLFD